MIILSITLFVIFGFTLAFGNRSNLKSCVIPKEGLSKPFQTLNITVITWNLAEATPTEKDCDFIRSLRSEDIIVIGIQECEDIKPRRTEGRRSKAWKILQSDALGRSFDRVVAHKMGGIQIAVYAKKAVAKKIQAVTVMDVACGVGNVLTNKGAVCALIRLQEKTLAFVNAHLAAHQGKVRNRNEDYARIASVLSERAPLPFLTMPSIKKQSPRPAKGKKSATSERTKSKRNIDSFKKRSFTSAKGASSTEWLQKVLVATGLSNDPMPKPQGDRYSMQGSRKSTGTGTRVETKMRRGRGTSSGMRQASRKTKGKGAGKVASKVMGKSSSIPTNADAEIRKSSDTVEVGVDGDFEGYDLWPFDATIFFGDLNYRLDLPRLEVELFKARCCIDEPTPVGSRRVPPIHAQKQLQSILEYDQLTRERVRGRILAGFREGPITFLPTFKYDKRTDSFDSSGKRRWPAWTDRVLFKERTLVNGDSRSSKDTLGHGIGIGSTAGSSGAVDKVSDSVNCMNDSLESLGQGESHTPMLVLRNYSSVDVRHSDHRPVIAKFRVCL